jgi:hypothetical protein
MPKYSWSRVALFVGLCIAAAKSFAGPVEFEAVAGGSNIPYTPPAVSARYSDSQYLWSQSASQAIHSRGEFFRVVTTRAILEEMNRLKAQGQWNEEARQRLKQRALTTNEVGKQIYAQSQDLKNYDARGSVNSKLHLLPLEVRVALRQTVSAQTQRRLEELPLSVLGILEKAPVLATVPELYRTALDASVDLDRATLGRKEQNESVDFALKQESDFRRNGLGIMARAWEVCQNDAADCAVVEAANLGLFPHAPTASLEELQAGSPEATRALEVMEEARNAASPNEKVQKVREAQEALTEKLNARVQKGDADTKALEGLVQRIDELKSQIEQFRTDLAAKEAAEAELRQREAEAAQLAQRMAEEFQESMKELNDSHSKGIYIRRRSRISSPHFRGRMVD